MKRWLLQFPTLMMLLGCSQLQTHRDFLSEMNSDDSSYFSPKHDFPIVAGDTGRDWNTDEEFKNRTPASFRDVEHEREVRSLDNELKDLEGSLSENSVGSYRAAREKLNISERIYFLKLTPNEQRGYLESKGLLEAPKTHKLSSMDKAVAAENHHILIGMTKNDVVNTIGKPSKVEIAGNPRNENERWVYASYGAAKYIYFESGEVQGWE